ncbi:hypothetical protein N2152v2_008186 [Parachlorella kessleri]
MDLRGHTKFEASDISVVDGRYYVVFDKGEQNKLIGEMGDESQFEGIAWVPQNKTFLLLQERPPMAADRLFPRGTTVQSLHDHGDHYHPQVLEVKVTDDDNKYDILQSCEVEFELSHENKGFEGMAYVVNKKGSWLLGLCEGNHCTGGKKGMDAGNGRIVQMSLAHEDGKCQWKTERVIKVPRQANFRDYSAMAFNGESLSLAILSQEDAAIWVGEFDREEMEFTSEGKVYHFPRDNHCEAIYCNLEGVQWLDDYRLVVTSDKAKAKQPFYCDAKDQMVHIFAFPPGYEPPEMAAASDDSVEVQSRDILEW